MKKVLIVASVASMIDQFNMDNINLLLELGYKVDVACNFVQGSTCSNERIACLKEKLTKLNVDYYQIDFTRKIANLGQDYVAYKQVKELVKKNQYNFIHCHSPIGGVISRLVGHSTHTKVIYTAHGFHFFKGSSKKNWILFYPIEKFLSKYTDTLVTITKEDYDLASSKFHAKHTEYVHGVGIDLSKYKHDEAVRDNIRNLLGISKEDIMLFSVGELNANKNHKLVIDALASLHNPKLHYFIAGKGILQNELLEQIQNNNLENNVHLLGFREDIPSLLNASDVFLLPSIREGLNVSIMEAMACNLPVICNKIRGNVDLVDEQGGITVEGNDMNLWGNAIDILQKNREVRLKMGEYNRNKITDFSSNVVKKEMKKIYKNME